MYAEDIVLIPETKKISSKFWLNIMKSIFNSTGKMDWSEVRLRLTLLRRCRGSLQVDSKVKAAIPQILLFTTIFSY